jgi:hypothetical protein
MRFKSGLKRIAMAVQVLAFAFVLHDAVGGIELNAA